jgi:carbonic anhydrase
MPRRAEVLDGQAPFAVVITCSDSASLRIFFDQGIGDIFVIRTAGHVLDDVAVGSVEYAVEHFKVPLVLVIGHQKCGAVSAVASGGELSGHLVGIGREIGPAVAKAKTMQGDLVANAIDENIRNTAGRLIASEPVLAESVKAGILKSPALRSGRAGRFPVE